MLPAGLSFAVRAGERAASRSGQEDGNFGASSRPQRCLADRAAVILYSSRQSRSRPPKARCCGNTEAVFSSSGNRIRASQAKAAVAGPSIASGSSPIQTSRVGSARVGLTRLQKFCSPFCFLRIAASRLESGFRVSRFARNASMPYAPSGVASAQLAARVCFRLTRLLVLRASPDADGAAVSSWPSRLTTGRCRWTKGSERIAFRWPKP